MLDMVEVIIWFPLPLLWIISINGLYHLVGIMLLLLIVTMKVV